MRVNSQRGVALVVTLIMLSVITVMSVAFLAMTQRERSAVSQSTYQTEAKLMADTALERVKGMILAEIVATTNLLAPDLMVSRNYINPQGFNPSDGDALENVNYDFVFPNTNQALNRDQFLQNVANLYYDPRPPVFVNTNRGNQVTPTSGTFEFRFYVDLNRNGRFEYNGWTNHVDSQGRFLGPILHNFVGDPEWIGVLERLRDNEGELISHSRTNKFVGRYAYLVQPIGKTLDLNFIHNDAKQNPRMNNLVGFFRNQGFGTWELNLAAFLADLNTNLWHAPSYIATTPYNYSTNVTDPSSGTAFINARDLLRYRIHGNYANLRTVDYLFGAAGNAAFQNDFIDGYADGPWDFDASENDNPNAPWPGADSTNHFYTVHDFWRPGITPPPPPLWNYSDFSSRLAYASAQTSTYDRYTFYRLLEQLGIDSAGEIPRVTTGRLISKIAAERPEDYPAEPVGKINLNWDNLDYDASAFVGWDSNKFFNLVGNVLLRSQPFGFGITNIPVYPTNYYNATVHRVLQLAANIYDATKPAFDPTRTETYPSVFRPRFATANGITYINGYYQDNDATTVDNWLTNNTLGIPMVIGAKKGLPNFNEYAMQTTVLGARKLELRRPNTDSRPTMTNELYIIGISNYFGVEFWNSYTQTFAQQIRMRVGNLTYLALTNREFGVLYQKFDSSGVFDRNITDWRGFRGANHRLSYQSFQVPLSNTVVMLTNSVYRLTSGRPTFDPVGTNLFPRTQQDFLIPDLVLTVSNRLTGVLSCQDRIIDFVCLNNLTNAVSITEQFMGSPNAGALIGENNVVGNCWLTNRLNNSTSARVPTQGIQQQMDISLGQQTVDDPTWKNFNYQVLDKQKSIEAFQTFVYPQIYSNSVNSNLVMQAPFAPTRKFVLTTSWQVNDPLVHYIPEHLKDLTNNFKLEFVKPGSGIPTSEINIGEVNSRYSPWGGNPQLQSVAALEADLSTKDPGVFNSDHWNFPTNKFPSIGWLGRVHRGTPWQTVYLKSAAADGNTWRRRSMEILSHPTNDWRLLDMFTVAVHPNATRGQLSINQTNLAAWSAVLSGVVTLTNAVDPNSTSATNFNEPYVIEPAVISTQLLHIVNGINRTRDFFPGGTFRRLGEICSVPELTVNSPFLLKSSDPMFQGILGTPDEPAYEAIPEHVLSLLKVGDSRFVVYAFGQSLRPAENSIVTSGPYFGMCTNYQITGEVVTRSVLRIDGTARNPRPVLETFNVLSSD